MAFCLGLALRPALQSALRAWLLLLLRWLRRSRTQTLWRVSDRPWEAERADTALPWLPHPCPHCTQWGSKWERLHAAVAHICKPVGAGGEDRCCSTTGHAALAVRRLETTPEVAEASPRLLHRVVCPPAAVAWDARDLAGDAAAGGFRLGDFASTCLQRRDAADYAQKWGVVLQEVLVDRCRASECQTISITLEKLLQRWPDALATSQRLANLLRRALAAERGERAPHWADALLGLPWQRLLVEVQHWIFERRLTAAIDKGA